MPAASTNQWYVQRYKPNNTWRKKILKEKGARKNVICRKNESAKRPAYIDEKKLEDSTKKINGYAEIALNNIFAIVILTRKAAKCNFFPGEGRNFDEEEYFQGQMDSQFFWGYFLEFSDILWADRKYEFPVAEDEYLRRIASLFCVGTECT